MMKKIVFFGFFLILFGFGCQKTNGFKSEFDKSYRAWLSFRKSCNNTYQYTRITSSWTGFKTSTTLFVENGVVVKRAFTVEEMWKEPNVIESWEEDLTQLNTHESGAEVLTLDALYNKAKTVWLKVDASTNEIIFETKHSGMISTCGYVPHGCADDCFTGVTISEIKPL